MAPTNEIVKKESWPEGFVLLLCEFLNKYITKNGRNSAFKWTTLQPEFEKSIKHKFNSDRALKNKYDTMRKEYNLWKSLKNGATGLGWNQSTGKLECSDEWWEKRISENPKIQGLKKRQPSIELQEAWDQLFGDAVASGVDCVAPSIDPSTLKEVHHVNLEDDNVGSDDDVESYLVYGQYPSRLENLETQEDNFYKNFMKEVNQKDVETPNLSGCKPSHTVTEKSTHPKPVKMKRKGRESGGAAIFKELVTQNKATNQRVLQILESDASIASQGSKFSIDEVMKVIYRMEASGLMTIGDELYMFGMDLFEDAVKREIFINQPDDNVRLTWLKHKQNQRN